MIKVNQIIEEVGAARERFQSRYTMGRLKSLDPELHANLTEQDDEFTLVAVTEENPTEVIEFGESTIRGWQLALERMEALGEPVGVFHVGLCPKTGTAVVISDDKRSLERMREQYPEAVHMSPDEVATLVGGLGAVADVKRKFNGSEITRADTK